MDEQPKMEWLPLPDDVPRATKTRPEHCLGRASGGKDTACVQGRGDDRYIASILSASFLIFAATFRAFASALCGALGLALPCRV